MRSHGSDAFEAEIAREIVAAARREEFERYRDDPDLPTPKLPPVPTSDAGGSAQVG